MNLSETVDLKKNREFGLLIGLAIILTMGLIIPWRHHQAFPVWPWLMGFVLWMMAWLTPGFLSPFYRLWMIVGNGMGWVNSRIILSVVFFVMVMPIGWVMRSPLNKPLLQTQLSDDVKTYRVLSETKRKSSMENPF